MKNAWTKKGGGQRRFLQKIEKVLDIQDVNAILKYGTPLPYSMWFYGL